MNSILEGISSQKNKIKVNNLVKDLIIEKASAEALLYFNNYINVTDPKTLVVATTSEFNILNHPTKINAILNLSKVNNIRYINKFF